MGQAINKLLSLSTDALGPEFPAGPDGPVRLLTALLSQRNGFYAFESALHVFPLGGLEGVMDLESWNSESLWRGAYRDAVRDCYFFAEDIFCNQFCVRGSTICTFNPETARIEELAADIEAWAQLMLDDYRELTFWPLAHEWQVQHGALPPGKRLAPKLPFILGGEFAAKELWACDPVERMNFCADMCAHIGNLPDGAKVKIVVARDSDRKERSKKKT